MWEILLFSISVVINELKYIGAYIVPDICTKKSEGKS